MNSWLVASVTAQSVALTRKVALVGILVNTTGATPSVVIKSGGVGGTQIAKFEANGSYDLFGMQSEGIYLAIVNCTVTVVYK